jgi:proline iminopeptidase
MFALLYATTYPDRVNKILLTAAIGVTSEGLQVFEKELEKRLSDEDKVKLVGLEESENNQAFLNDVLRILDSYYVYSSDTLLHKENTSIHHAVNESIGKDMLENYDITPHIHKLTNIPILVTQGSHGMLTPALIQDLLLSYIPHTTLIELKNCGHWTVVEKPTEMNEIARGFFWNLIANWEGIGSGDEKVPSVSFSYSS